MSAYDDEFWFTLERLTSESRRVIDRPKGTAHPHFPGMLYPVDYGYLEGTLAADGGGIDVWIGSDPAGRLQGLLCSIDMAKRDAEIKLIIGCTAQELKLIVEFMNQHGMHVLLVERAMK